MDGGPTAPSTGKMGGRKGWVRGECGGEWGWVRAEEGRELQGVAQAGSEPTLALKMGAQVPTEAR